MYAGVWSTEPGGGGGVFKSADGGRSWRALPGIAGQSVRSLVQAPTDPRLLVAGSLQSIFRSLNGGRSWERISPAYHEEIRTIESLAIDPSDPRVIYAGTWHLPWKTTDGGRSWNSIRAGIIEDSDIFSILIDWSNPRRLYASACSGIYRSDSAGELWKKIQGIPHSARRTRVIRQDPRNPAVVYAGTTEGLWKTESGGNSWRRLTSATLVVNDVLINPANPSHLLLATDRAGVLESADGGEHFLAANYGFSHRQVSRSAFDPEGGMLYAAVLNDREYGGVFATTDAREWRRISEGLEQRNVFALIYARSARGGRLLAGLRDDLVAFDAQRNAWFRTGIVAGSYEPSVPKQSRDRSQSRDRNGAGPNQSRDRKGAGPNQNHDPRRPRAGPRPNAPGFTLAKGSPVRVLVNDFFQEGPDQPVYAATSSGILKTTDGGETWDVLSPPLDFTAITGAGRFLVAGTRYGLELSLNGGGHWFHIYLPTGTDPGHVNALALAGKTIFAATDAGLFRSTDGGARWEKKGAGVPYGPITGVRILPANPREVYVTTRLNRSVYLSQDGGQTFQRLPDGVVGSRLRGLEIFPDRGASSFQVLVTSAFDGLFQYPVGAHAPPGLSVRATPTQ